MAGREKTEPYNKAFGWSRRNFGFNSFLARLVKIRENLSYINFGLPISWNSRVLSFTIGEG